MRSGANWWAATLVLASSVALAEAPRAPVSHERYVPNEMIGNAEAEAALKQYLKVFARPGDAIVYRLEPGAGVDLTGIEFSVHEDAFSAPSIGDGGRSLSVTVLPAAGALETKATLLAVDGDTPLRIDPIIVVRPPTVAPE